MEESAIERPLDQEFLRCLNPADRIVWRRVITRQVAAGPDSFLCKTADKYGVCYAAQPVAARMWLLSGFFFLVFLAIALVISRGAMTVEPITFLIRLFGNQWGLAVFGMTAGAMVLSRSQLGLPA